MFVFDTTINPNGCFSIEFIALIEESFRHVPMLGGFVISKYALNSKFNEYKLVV